MSAARTARPSSRPFEAASASCAGKVGALLRAVADGPPAGLQSDEERPL